METGICTKTLSCVLVSTCTSNCRTFMLMRRTTFSMNGVFQLRPGPATREFAEALDDGDFGSLHGEEGAEHRAEDEQEKDYAEDGEERGERFHAGSPWC